MQTAVRPHFTAGIAALGASAIIATTATVAPPHAHIAPMSALPDITSSVELAALVNPVSAIGDVIRSTVTDLQQLVGNLSADPFPIANVLIPDTVRAIGQLLGIGQATVSSIISGAQHWIPFSIRSFINYAKAGDWENAMIYFITPLAGIGLGLSQPFTDLANLAAGPLNTAANLVKAVPNIVLQVVAGGVLSPVGSVLQAVGYGIDQFSSALKSGNLGNLYNAVVNTAVHFTNTVISGLVGPYGIIGTLLNVRNTIAEALNPSTTSAAATAASTVPSTAAKSVTLSATTAAADTPTKVSKATGTAVSDAKVAETTTKVAAKDTDGATTVDATKTDSATDTAKTTKEHAKTDATAGQAGSNTKGSKGTHAKGGKNGVGKRSHTSHHGHSHHNN